ncbi:MAG: hypothetical protein ABI399_04820 [Bauldia sp.]
MLQALPLTVFPLIVFNVVAFALSGGSGDPFAAETFGLTVISGARWVMTLGDLMILLGIVCLFFEVLRATNSASRSIANHVLSTIVLIVYIVEFIVVRQAADSVFFILTVIALFDVIAGFSISIRAASRDVTVARTFDTGN